MPRIVGLALALGLLLNCRPAMRPDGGSGLLPPGATAPNAAGTNREGQTLSLRSTVGHASVVYFYPRDETPGCTREACAFRDIWEEYAKRGVTVFGVSQDSAQSHQAFAKHHQLQFFLVADESGKLAEAYGVSSVLGFNSRVSFLISPTGKVAQVWPDVDPGVHAQNLLQAIDAHGFAIP